MLSPIELFIFFLDAALFVVLSYLSPASAISLLYSSFQLRFGLLFTGMSIYSVLLNIVLVFHSPHIAIATTSAAKAVAEIATTKPETTTPAAVAAAGHTVCCQNRLHRDLSVANML